MRIVHTADIHFDKRTQEKAIKCLRELMTVEGVDLYVIAGDMFGKTVSNTKGSGFTKLIGVVQEMLDKAPIVAVEGTPTHDIEGCYEALKAIRGKYDFIVLEPVLCYYLTDGNRVERGTRPHNAKMLIVGLPEWPKAEYAHAISIDESTKVGIDAINATLRWYGEKRKINNDLRAIFVGHGVITGAVINDSQNIFTGVEIDPFELSRVDCDYYAMGHIHEPQTVELPHHRIAHYAGSCFPLSWNEEKQKTYNIVDIPGDIGKPIEVSYRPYPYPPQKKIYGLQDDISYDGVEGKIVRLVIQVKELENTIPIKEIERQAKEKLIAAGALSESVVNVEILRGDNSRDGANEIRRAPTLFKKVKEWARTKDTVLSDGIEEKVRYIESQIGICKGETGIGIVKLLSIRIRGLIGPMDIQGIEEIFIDFTKFGPGIIVLHGENGSGKTSIIESCIPYLRMVSRGGRLADHYCLPDSYREIIWEDVSTKTKYRSLVNIKGGQKIEAYIQKEIRGEWVKLDGINGRQESYLEWCDRLWGSFEMYIRCGCFSPQSLPKGMSVISDATTQEMKTLMIDILGLNFLEDAASLAKQKKECLRQELIDRNSQLSGIEKIFSTFSDKSNELSQKEELKKRIVRLGKRARGRGAINAKRCEVIKEKTNKQNQMIAVLAEKRKQYKNNEEQVGRLEAERPKSTLKDTISVLCGFTKEYDLLCEEEKRLRVQYHSDMEAYREKVEELRESKSDIEQQIRSKAKKEDDISKGIISCRKEIEDTNDNCSKCGQPLPDDIRESLLQKKIEWTKDIELLTKDLEIVASEIEGLTSKNKELQDAIDSTVMPRRTELLDVQEKISSYGIEKVRENLEQARTASTRTKMIDSRIADLVKENESIQEEIVNIESGIDHGLEEKAKRMQYISDRDTRYIFNVEQEYRDCMSAIKTISEQQEKYITLREEIGSLKSEISKLQIDIDQWEYLEFSFGKKGIQAMELDAVLPEISQIANDLLRNVYNSENRLLFRTLRTGAAKNCIETFEIMIESAGKEPCLLSQRSGGQKTLEQRALEDALEIVRGKSWRGIKHLVVFRDERESALDPEKKVAYMRMLQKYMAESGIHQMLMVTHSQDLIDMASQVITVKDLTGEGCGTEK
jgi:DNA repair exonuclease SbcCD nuclease subunit/predicted ATPase